VNAPQVPVKQEIRLGITYPHEKELLRILLLYANKEVRLEDENNPTVLQYIISEIKNDDLEFQHPVYKRIFEEAQRILQAGEIFDNQTFTHHADPDICRIAVDLTTENYELSMIWRKNEVRPQTEDMKLKELVPEIVMAFKNKKVIDMIKENQQAIVAAQKNNDQEYLQLLQQKFIILNELKKSFSKKLGDRIII